MDQTSASASSPMATTTRKRKRTAPSTIPYQVFINHRGPDVKRSLASVIHHCLQSKGLRVFLDKDEFQPGQPLESTIQNAIRTSSVHIAIFSKRYAESDGCLKELCLMLATGAPIIPVFYNVRPNDLRWIEKGKGKYASAFAVHEEKGRFDSQTISDWKSALKKVSYVSGIDFGDPNTVNRDLGQFLKRMKDNLLKNLGAVPLEMPPDAVGLDEAIGHFESFIESEQQNENEKVKIVGIVGLGGSGKTTLAKEFFNRKRSSFERCSFLFDLRDASNRNALPGLQCTLLQDLLQVKDDKIKIDNVTVGKGMIREKLQSSTPRVLIVLDDIDLPKQVEALLVKDVLGSGSVIIITSRDEEAVKLSDPSIFSIYRIKTLSPEHAQDLFCRHAFRQPYPMVGFEDLVKKFCERCGALPLFLKVTGAHLRVNANNDREVWEDELKYIPKGISDILDVAYNAMCKDEKQIFLDIACFFLGEDKNLATKVWDTCQGRGLLHLKNLESKCLVEFGKRNCFKMHDHVRDFGRDIADKESPRRLWNESQAANVGEQQKATRDFRGIMAATCDSSRRFYISSHEPPLKGRKLSALKILAIRGDCFDEEIAERSENLVWLRWHSCPHTNIPRWLISMKNLTVLELIGGDIEEWRPCEQVHLRQLTIVYSNLSMISISANDCLRLENLRLRDNSRLKLMEVEHLPRLRDLDISWCFGLRELPNLQHLPSLETLNAYACINLQHIHASEHLPWLRDLDISWCSELRELPNLQHLPSVETLNASGCKNLQHIHASEHLPRLRVLEISCCYELRELPNLQHLPSLETLNASCCKNLQHIHASEHLPRLRDLDISWCSELRELPNLQHLPSLERLNASGCSNLQHIHASEHLPRLRELRELPNLQHLPSLETFKASDCTKLQHIQGLEHLPNLRQLRIAGCFEL